jgi:hypothetical protein
MAVKRKPLSHKARTRFGEERVPLGTLEIRITSRCNFGCDFCFARDEMRGPDMTLNDFKRVINQIAETARLTGQKPNICVGGGEPFLHKDVERMMSYAVGILGRDNVEITTNLSKFPTNPDVAQRLLARMGYPKLNMSVDREHLKYGTKVPEKIAALVEAARRTGTHLGIITVGKSLYEKEHPFPKRIKRVVPGKLRLRLKNDMGDSNRIEQYSLPHLTDKVRKFVSDLAQGKAKGFPPAAVSFSTNLMPLGLHRHQDLIFANDGKLYMHPGLRAFFSPLLSIGNWRRESFLEMTNQSLPYKRNMLMHWMGLISSGEMKKIGRLHAVLPKQESVAKERLYGTYLQKRFQRQSLRK